MKSIYRNTTIGQAQILHSTQVVLSLSGYDLAEVLYCSDTREWARFFNKLAEKIAEEGNLPLHLEYITQEEILTDKARSLMSMIGDYAYHNQGCKRGEQ